MLRLLSNLKQRSNTVPRDYQQTHENLLQNAKRLFLAKGYERTNLREICKDANVTNGAFYRHFSDKESLFGALVEPVVQTISNMYSQSVSKHFQLTKSESVSFLWELSEQTVVEIINYIYQHFDTFRLLLMCSDGTKYASFLDDVVRLDVQETLHLMEKLQLSHPPLKSLEEDEWHMLVHSYYASLAEIVMHHYPKEAALNYAHTLSEFFSAGWQKILGITP